MPHINLEVVAPGPERDAITMRVHERGAGITAACGTGAAAAAWPRPTGASSTATSRNCSCTWTAAAREWRSTVPAPGRVTLTGPATFVATIEIPQDA